MLRGLRFIDIGIDEATLLNDQARVTVRMRVAHRTEAGVWEEKIATEAEYTPPIIYSNETRAKLVFMVEARPALADAAKLRPGQPVSVTLK